MFNFFKKKPMNYNNIDAVEFKKLIDEGGIVLDVRSPGELAEGSITGYKQINLFDRSFKTEIDRLDKSKTYLVYCRSGNRSGQACAIMDQMGFEKLYNLNGGISAWRASVGAI